jgi:hypothetical protein
LISSSRRRKKRTVEAALGFEVPTREEMQKIEISSRLYRENDILSMTATILHRLIRVIQKVQPARDEPSIQPTYQNPSSPQLLKCYAKLFP